MNLPMPLKAYSALEDKLDKMQWLKGLGLFTRFAGIGFFCMTTVIALFVYPGPTRQASLKGMI